MARVTPDPPPPSTQETGDCTDLWAAVGLSVDDFWRGIERAAAERVQQLVLAVDVRKTKVGDLATSYKHTNSVTTPPDTNTHSSVTTPPDTNTHSKVATPDRNTHSKVTPPDKNTSS